MPARRRHRRGARRREAGRRAGASGRQHAASRVRRPGAAAPRRAAVVRARDGVQRSTSTSASVPVTRRRFAASWRTSSIATSTCRASARTRPTGTPPICALLAPTTSATIAGSRRLRPLPARRRWQRPHRLQRARRRRSIRRTRVVMLADDTRRALVASFGGEPVPARALTIGVATILAARRCVLLAYGAAKAGVIARAVDGPPTAGAAGVGAAASRGRDDHRRRRGGVSLAWMRRRRGGRWRSSSCGRRGVADDVAGARRADGPGGAAGVLGRV